jgi:sigma-B regulation protein RsbU (phosphoserine phosphatase)
MAPSSSETIRILLIDDTPINLRLLQITLEGEGYTVFSTNNGPQGRQIAENKSPHLILLDIHMPGEDGFETIKKLKQNPKTAAIPVLFLTANDETESKIKGFDLGAVDYIVKPFHHREVLARVRLHLKIFMANNIIINNQAAKLRQIQNAQSAMLIQPDNLPEANFAVYYSSLLEAGGDFYDVIQISKQIFAYLVADVSGHDIGTSFITAAMKALLKQNATPVYSPIETIGIINNVLQEILPADKYLTLIYLHLNRQKKMTLVSGGHPPVLHLPVNDKARLIELGGDAVGIFKNATFDSQEIPVCKGDRFIAYSDGLLERPDTGRVWTAATDELLQIADELRTVPIRKAADKVNDLFNQHHEPPDDDIVIMAIEI